MAHRIWRKRLDAVVIKVYIYKSVRVPCIHNCACVGSGAWIRFRQLGPAAHSRADVWGPKSYSIYASYFFIFFKWVMYQPYFPRNHNVKVC